MCIGVTRDEGPYRRECCDTEYQSAQCHQDAYYCHEECSSCEMYGKQLLMCSVLNQRKAELIRFLFFVVLCHKNCNFVPDGQNSWHRLRKKKGGCGSQ